MCIDLSTSGLRDADGPHGHHLCQRWCCIKARPPLRVSTCARSARRQRSTQRTPIGLLACQHCRGRLGRHRHIHAKYLCSSARRPQDRADQIGAAIPNMCLHEQATVVSLSGVYVSAALVHRHVCAHTQYGTVSAALITHSRMVSTHNCRRAQLLGLLHVAQRATS